MNKVLETAQSKPSAPLDKRAELDAQIAFIIYTFEHTFRERVKSIELHRVVGTLINVNCNLVTNADEQES